MIRPTYKAPACLIAAALVSCSPCFGLLPIDAFWSTAAYVNKAVPACSGDDLPIVPNGETASPGWALARLNSGSSPLSAAAYVYPETSVPVRLYLIDNSVANPGGWFDANPNLSIETVLIGNTTVPRSTTHATQILGLIAGPETGAALGTNIEVINYDIYPSGGQSSSGLLIEAIYEAIDHNEDNPGKPGIICIAAGSATTGSSSGLEYAVDEAIAEGLAVIVSAGNSNQPAANFVPSAYGTMDGVICVGASNKSNGKWSTSNYGSAVDIYAPGENVATLKLPTPVSGQTSLISGSSPATAFATAAALATLSMNPELSPADLENSLKSSSYDAPVDLVQLPPLDSDGDGVHDLVETFSGSDPLKASDIPTPPSVTGSAIDGVNTVLTLGFIIDADLYNPGNPHALSNGMTWRIMQSTNLKDWSESTSGVLTAGASTGGLRSMSYSCTTGDESCFLKLEIIPAP